ncbi:lipopolysaccharide biosynthesis protein [Rathayibacter sp. YIM 133350]|uniref:lipopolysaccharide biosynthesis protein n=1 Tax=Rathayibacter sp. YIM 133350 TaxID=3131992 RepID=UPI00307ED90E
MRHDSARGRPTPGVGSGVAWSTVNSLALRLGGLVVGIVLARVLTPEQFGLYAIALTVQTILMTLADLGLSADLIRSDDPRKRAPTVATLGATVGFALTLTMIALSGQVAATLGAPAAAPAIAVLSGTLLLAGIGVVPYAMLQRRFEQRKLFVVAAVDLVLSTVVTLCLIAAGWGVLSLAIGRVVAQGTAVVLQFVLAREVPRFGVDRSLLRPILAFGLPVAAANFLSWALLNVDNVVIARLVGPAALGLYVLAFNISSWPMTAIAQVVRSVALPYFSRASGAEAYAGLRRATVLTWAASLPAGTLLAVLSTPVIVVLYGEKWAGSAVILASLGIVGSFRAVFDNFASYLLARGSSRSVLIVQVIWFVSILVGMIVGTAALGIIGAALVHVVVSVLVVLPAYLVTLRRHGVRLRPLLSGSAVPTIATVPAAGLAALIQVPLAHSALLALLCGGCAAAGVYWLLVRRWLKRELAAARKPSAQSASAVAPQLVQVVPPAEQVDASPTMPQPATPLPRAEASTS